MGRLARRTLPAPLVGIAQRLATPLSGWEQECVTEGWQRASTDQDVTGWNVAAIRDAYTAKWPSFVRATQGAGPLGIHHEVTAGNPVKTDDVAAHNTVMAFAYVLALTAHRRRRISVLDWGGALGHYFLISRTVLPDVDIEYHCKEVPLLAARGRELLPEVTFHEDEACLDAAYDLVLASNSIQYSERWREVMKRLASCAGRFLFLTRVPITHSGPPFVVVERPYAYGYDAQYLGWVLNRDGLLTCAADNAMELVREFILSEASSIPGTRRKSELRGFLFRPRPLRGGGN